MEVDCIAYFSEEHAASILRAESWSQIMWCYNLYDHTWTAFIIQKM